MFSSMGHAQPSRLGSLTLYANRIASGSVAAIAPFVNGLVYNPNPLRCGVTGSGSLVCDECVQGFINDTGASTQASLVCMQPRFGLLPTGTVRGADINRLLAAAAENLPATLVQGQALPVDPAFSLGFLGDRRASFVGFAGDPSEIAFELGFGPRLGIGCGRTAVGNTAAAGSATAFQTGVGSEHGFYQWYRSPEHNLEFSVAVGGEFTFDGCESPSATELAIYGLADQAAVLAAVRAYVEVNSRALPSSVARQPTLADQCHLGAGYNWTVTIPDPGTYVLVVQGAHDDPADSSADYTVRMACHGGAATAAADPGGIVIDPGTGRVAGSPGATGSFAVRINAVDATTGARAELHAWDFAVAENVPFALRPGCSAATADAEEGAEAISYHPNMGTVPIPGFGANRADCSRTAAFVGSTHEAAPTETRFDLEIPTLSDPEFEEMVCFNPRTGAIALSPRQVGNHAATLAAIDGAGSRLELVTFDINVTGTSAPTQLPTQSPTDVPTSDPSRSPTHRPTATPTPAPTWAPSRLPTTVPTGSPTVSPSASPTQGPTSSPTAAPTSTPTMSPTGAPVNAPFAVSDVCRDQMASISAAANQASSRVGQTSRIEGFRINSVCSNKSAAFAGYYAHRDPDQIRFSVEWTGDGAINDILTSQQTGYSYVTPDRIGNYSGSLIATDSDGAKLSIANWTLVVQTDFGLLVNRTAVDACGWTALWNASFPSRFGQASDTSTTRFDINTTVSLPAHPAGCALDSMFSGFSTAVDSGDPDIAFFYEMDAQAAECSGGSDSTIIDASLWNSKTGRAALVLGQPCSNLVVRIMARSGESTALVLSTSVDVRQPDWHGADATASCSGGVAEEDGVKQDGRYQCDCAIARTNTVPVAASVDNDWTPTCVAGVEANAAAAAADTIVSGVDDRVLIGGAGGALLLLVAAVLVTTRIKLYRLKHRPVDVGTTQDEVLASLGLAATTDIGVGEFGISLHFDAVFGRSTDGWAQFKADLVAALRKAAPQIKAALQVQQPHQQPTARVIVGGTETSRVLVVMPTAKSTRPPEAVAELLAAAAAKGALVVGDGRRRVVDASVAVPRRVPREVPRSALTRIKLLGEGAFGAVHQYQLDERSMPAYFVAAKSIRAGKSSGSADARDALLREAALAALLDHRNVVATVGVVTAPRDVPVLLLLAFCAEGTLEALAAAASPAAVSTAERLTYCAQTLQGLQYIASIRIVHRDVAARNVLLDATMTCKVRARLAASIPTARPSASARCHPLLPCVYPG